MLTKESLYKIKKTIEECGQDLSLLEQYEITDGLNDDTGFAPYCCEECDGPWSWSFKETLDIVDQELKMHDKIDQREPKK